MKKNIKKKYKEHSNWWVRQRFDFLLKFKLLLKLVLAESIGYDFQIVTPLVYLTNFFEHKKYANL